MLGGNPPFASELQPPERAGSVGLERSSLLSRGGSRSRCRRPQPATKGRNPSPGRGCAGPDGGAAADLVAGRVWELLGHRTPSEPGLASRAGLLRRGRDQPRPLHGSHQSGELRASTGAASTAIKTSKTRRRATRKIAFIPSRCGDVRPGAAVPVRGGERVVAQRRRPASRVGCQTRRARAFARPRRVAAGHLSVVSELGPEAYVESLHQWVLMLCLKQQWSSASRAVLALLDFCGVKVRGRIPSFWSPSLFTRARAYFVRACGSHGAPAAAARVHSPVGVPAESCELPYRRCSALPFALRAPPWMRCTPSPRPSSPKRTSASVRRHVRACFSSVRARPPFGATIGAWRSSRIRRRRHRSPRSSSTRRSRCKERRGSTLAKCDLRQASFKVGWSGLQVARRLYPRAVRTRSGDNWCRARSSRSTALARTLRVRATHRGVCVSVLPPSARVIRISSNAGGARRAPPVAAAARRFNHAPRSSRWGNRARLVCASACCGMGPAGMWRERKGARAGVDMACAERTAATARS